MEAQDVIKNNKLIAEFMGWSEIKVKIVLNNLIGYAWLCDEVEQWLTLENFKYHASWDWLMPALKEIEEKTGYCLVMAPGYAYWTKDGEQMLNDYEGFEDIANIYKAVVDLIEWHNETVK